MAESIYADPESLIVSDIASISIDDLRLLFGTWKRTPLGYAELLWTGKWDKAFTWDDAFKKAKSLDIIPPKSLLDNFWIEQEEESINIFKVHYNFYAQKFNVNTIDKIQYYDSLGKETDAIDYCRRLALYPSAGIIMRHRANPATWKDSSGKIWGPPDVPYYIDMKEAGDVKTYPSELDKQFYTPPDKYYNREAQRTFTIPYPLTWVNTDRAGYAMECKKFGELLLLRYFPILEDVLKYSQYQDLDYLSRIYQSLRARSTVDIPSAINTIETIMIYDRADNSLERMVHTSIPDDFSTGPKVSYPDGNVRTAREALRYEYDQAMVLVYANLLDIEAQIAALEDPGYTPPPVETWAPGTPKPNPFILLNVEASMKEGAPVYEDVSMNLARHGLKTELFKIEGGPTIEHYLKAPEIRARYTRKYGVDYGGSVSKNDLIRMGALPSETKKSIIPWLAGGALAGLAATQLL